MAFSHDVTTSIRRGSDTPIASTKTLTASSEVNLDEAVSVGTDTPFNIAIDVSAVKSFYIHSDRAVTVETNSSSAPTNTLALVAGDAYTWYTGKLDTFKLTGDVTIIYITNASGGTANVTIRCLQDSSP